MWCILGGMYANGRIRFILTVIMHWLRVIGMVNVTKMFMLEGNLVFSRS
jgi:hypothetical protein